MQTIEKRRAFIINTVYVTILVGLFYLAIKYALGIVWPFLTAFFLAMLLQKPVNFLVEKTPLRRGLSSVIMVLFLLVIIGSILGLLIARIVFELRSFFSFILMKLEDAPSFVQQVTDWLKDALSFLPASIGDSVTESVNDFLTHLLGLEEEVTAGLPQATQDSGFDFSMLSSPLGAVWGTAKQIPMIAVGILVCIVSCCFMTSDYRNIRDMILRQMHPEKRQNVVHIKKIIFSTLGKMGKAYSIIIGVTFLEMSIGLSILKLTGVYTGNYIFAIALITAIVDILPILGTGTILIPWAVWSLCTGGVGLGIGLLVLYAIISIVRQILEPKLVASQLGLPPFLTIMAMYVGTQLFGFIGLFLLPITVMLLKVLYDDGIIFTHHTRMAEAVQETVANPPQDEKQSIDKEGGSV